MSDRRPPDKNDSQPDRGRPLLPGPTATQRIGLPHHFEWLKGVIVTILVLNVLDGVLTAYWIATDAASEANPLMDYLFDLHPVLFMAFKLCLVILGTLLLWRLRKNRAAVVSIFGLFFLYYVLLLYHLQHMNLRLFRKWFD